MNAEFVPVSGEIIRRLRLMMGVKQTAAAEKLGITQQAYSKLEKRKKVSDERLQSVLKALNCGQTELEEIIKLNLPS